MSVGELQQLEEVQGLIDKGQRVGVLTHAEIATATAGLDVDEADVEELCRFFAQSEIELVEDLDPTTAVANEVERVPPKRGRPKARIQLDPKPDVTTDSLQLFLKDIGKFRLLTAREEVDLASGSSAATSTPSRSWSSPTCAWWSRSPRTTATRGCPSST